MPEFEITAPDGRRFVVTAPEGASQEEVLRFAQGNTPPAPERGMVEGAASLAGQFGAGTNQGLASLVGGPFDLVNRGLRAVGVPIPEGSVTGTVQRGINSVVGEPAPPRGLAERLARGAGRGLVDAASIALPAAGVARMTAPLAGAAPSLTNGVASALASQPGMQVASGMVGGSVGEATDNPLLGAAAAFATPVVAGMAGRLITPIRPTPNPGREALVRTAEAEGIPLTAGQATGNRFLQNVEGQLEQLPLTAGPQRAIREGQNRAFISAAMRRAGETATDTSSDTLNAARNRIGGTIGAIANRNTLEVTPQLDGALTQIDDSLRFLPAEAAGPVRARIEQLRGMVVPGTPGSVPDTIPGASYRLMDSQLGRSMRSTSNGDLRSALGDLRTILRDAMDQSISPQDASAWAQARREYANLMTIADAAKGAGAGAAEGQMSPVALRQALNRSTGGGYAFGRGDLNELARVGQSLLRAPPDSGTAGRTMANNLLTGNMLAAGAGGTVGGPLGAMAGVGLSTAMPRLAQMLMNSGPGQSYLRNQVVQQPVVTRSLLAALLGQQGLRNANPGP